MKRMKLVSLLLAAAMLLALLPVTASAAVIGGDIDGDGSVSSSDARLALRWSVHLEDEASLAAICPQSGYNFKKAADVDLDGEITSSDARMILRGSVMLEYTETFGMDESQIYRNGHFYLKGTIVSDTTSVPLEIALTDTTHYFGTAMDLDAAGMVKEGIETDPVKIGIMQLGEDVYFTYPDGKSMLLMDESMADLDLGLTMQVVDQMRLVDDPNASPVQIKTVIVNDVPLVCNVYETSEGLQEWHYMNKNKLVRVESYDADDGLIMRMDVNSLSASIAPAMCSLPNDYKQYTGGMLGLLAFFTDILESLGLTMNDLNLG